MWGNKSQNSKTEFLVKLNIISIQQLKNITSPLEVYVYSLDHCTFIKNQYNGPLNQPVVPKWWKARALVLGAGGHTGLAKLW